MKNNKEDYSDKPISQSPSPDTTGNSDRPETAKPQSPADLARSRSIFIDLFTSTPKAWQKTEAKLLDEESPEELAAKRDIFIGLMSGISKAWEKIVEGLTHEIMHPFRVPKCWAETTSLPTPPSNISVFMTSGGAGIGVNWVDHSTNEEGFNIAYSPTQDVVSAKHALVEANQTFLSSDWGLTYTNGLLAAGQTMCFQVNAYNATGSSAPTALGCITVP